MRKIFLAFFVLLACAVGGALWILHDPQSLASIARWSVERALPGIRVMELKIGEQNLSWSQKGIFKNVSCVMKMTGRILVIKVNTLEISGFRTLLSSTKVLALRVVGADIDSFPGKARGVTAEFEVHLLDKGAAFVVGPVTSENLLWDKIKAGRTSCQVKADAKSVELRDILSEAYGGTISGLVRIIPHPLSYEADIKADRIQTSKLAEYNEQIGAQVAGRLSGTVRVSGDAKRPTSINLDFQMPSGGKVNATLLSALMQYLPKSRERKRLDILIKNGGKLAVEVFSFTIKSNTPDHLSGLVKLASKEANLELNLTHDILTDGTWDGLAESWQTIFK